MMLRRANDIASGFAFLSALVATCAHAGTIPQESAEEAWTRLGRPLSGIQSSGGWLFSGIQKPINPSSVGFEGAELAGCQQEATVQLIEHCIGIGELPIANGNIAHELARKCFDSWYFSQFQLNRAVWVNVRRHDGVDVAVLAVLDSDCAKMPKRAEWRTQLRQAAESAPDWIHVAALSQIAEGSDRTSLAKLAEERLVEESPRPDGAWPAGFLRLTKPLSYGDVKGLPLPDVWRVCRARPGDRELFSALSKRCEEAGLTFVLAKLEQLAQELRWPEPAPSERGHDWRTAAVDGLPQHLIAVVQNAGALPALAVPADDRTKQAAKAFFAEDPDLAAAEKLCRAACERPDADALNILAAIRLSSQEPTREALVQSLAFSNQAAALDFVHPYARVNIVRALVKLGWLEQAKVALDALPSYPPDSWQMKQVDAMSEVLSKK